MGSLCSPAPPTDAEDEVVRREIACTHDCSEDITRAFDQMKLVEGCARSRWSRSSVTLVAGGLCFRGPASAPQVLLILEAKASCAGKWYLPMGRVEPGEEIKEGAAREILEESGLVVSVGNLLVASTSKPSWHRFIYACSVKGGALKQTADDESVRAEWWPVATVMDGGLPMRGQREIVESIRVGSGQYLKTLGRGQERIPWSRLGTRERLEPCPALLYRVCLTRNDNAELLIHAASASLPTVAVPLGGLKPRFYIVQFVRSLLGDGAEARVTPPVALCLRSQLGGDSPPRHAGLCVTLLFSLAEEAESFQPRSAEALPPLRVPTQLKWVPLQPKLGRTLAFIRLHAARYTFK